MEFLLKIWIDEPQFCNGCPSLDTITADDPMCKSGEFYMKHENIGKGKPNWIVRRPRGCPLREVPDEVQP